MTATRLLSLLASAALLAACAATPPRELVGARDAYRRASAGAAATLAPADLHVARQALDQAEQAFEKDSGSFQTRDLAYVAQRRSELAEARASILSEQQTQARANEDFQATQGAMAAEARKELARTREALATSERAGERRAEQLSTERDARAAAEQESVLAQQRLAAAQQARTAAEQQALVVQERLAAAQQARTTAEQQATELQAALANVSAVREEARGMVISLTGSVLFASNQATLLPAARRRLDQVSAVLLTTGGRTLIVEGHTDSYGSDAWNLELSQARADAVRSYLVGKGYQADLISARGLGEGQPVADNATAEGRANNRRVEIVVKREPHASNP